MAGPGKRGPGEARRALQVHAPSRFEIAAALALGFLAAALTVLQSVRGADPDTAAASGTAWALGAFAGCLAVAALMPINASIARWYGRRVLEPWAERLERRREAAGPGWGASGSVADADGPPERADRVRRDRFLGAAEWAAYGSWAVFASLSALAVSRALLAAGGPDGGGAHPALVASLAVSGASSLLVFQMPLAAPTWRLMRAGRAAGRTGKAPDRPERGGAAETGRPAPAEPVVKLRFGPVLVPGWRRAQPGAR